MDERNVGGLWCHEVLTHLDLFVEGTLPETDLAAVKAHVAECTACAQFGAAYARLVTALRTSPEHALSEARMQRLRNRMKAVS